MAVSYAYAFINSFVGGLNLRDADHKIADNEAKVLTNYIVNADGSLEKRGGSAKYNAVAIASSAVKSLFKFYQSVGSYAKMLCVCNSVFYEDDGAGGWTNKGSLSNDNKCYFQTWNDICYFFNGTDKKQYNGTTLSNISGSPPAGKYVTLHKDRLYVAGVDANPNRVHYCDTNDATTWTGFYDIDSDDGDKITGLLPLNGVLIIYKENSVFLLQGNDNETFSLRKVADKVGCVAPGTLISYQGLHLFRDSDGVFAFNGQYARKVSGKVDPEIEGIPAAYRADEVAAIHKEHYWLSYTPSGETTNSKILVFDTRPGFNGWAKFDGLNVASFCNWNSGTDNWELYSGDSGATGFVRQLDTRADDDGTDIRAEYKSKNFKLGAPVIYKDVSGIVMEAETASTSVTVTINCDHGKQSETLNISLNTGGIYQFGTAKFDTAKFTKVDFDTFLEEFHNKQGRGVSIEVLEESSVSVKFSGLGFRYIPKPESFK